MKKLFFTGVLSCVLVFGFLTCSQESNKQVAMAENTYLNLHDSVGYVGISTCKQCHSQIHSTFIHTGMGQSFGKADTAKSAANFSGKVLVDADLNLMYHPFWEDSATLNLKEFRLKGNDTIHAKTQRINYVVGSGQHTNSHIYDENGYLFQAPFTWYAQKGLLDLPPGYEDGDNSRFSRPIGLECMSCHNAMPTGFVKGSYNKFTKVGHGIDCERCHGPGELHVKRVSSGMLVDTANEIDYSIVNPKKLDTQLQFEICQRCHLQGNTVLASNKSFFDFKPGMQLNEVMDVYLPRYENGENEFIMASHADRLKLSKCFIAGKGDFNCISCHNPHVSVKNTELKKFNNTCASCHGGDHQTVCTASNLKRQEKDDNCVSCHMPSSGSTDIPHVTVHDHYIRKPTETKAQELGAFLGLKAINNPKPTTRSKILAYLQQYERFEAERYYLDSARALIDKYTGDDNLLLKVHLYSLQGNFEAIRKYAELEGVANLAVRYKTMSYENTHAWFHYRIGEAYFKANQYAVADEYLRRATELAPLLVDFRSKYADNLVKLGEIKNAENQYLLVLQEQPSHKLALNNLAHVYLLQGKLDEAKKNLDLCITNYPDYEQARLNMAQYYLLQKDITEVRKSLEEVLRINPNNVVARQTLSSI